LFFAKCFDSAEVSIGGALEDTKKNYDLEMNELGKPEPVELRRA
jgi:hypothetical protein